MSKAKPTPGEWRVKEIARTHSWDYAIESVTESGTIRSVGKTIGIGKRHGEAEANARFIVRACNSHEELLEALKEITRCWQEEDITSVTWDAAEEAAEDAIAKAEGHGG